MCVPNFDGQFTAEMQLLPVIENERPSYWIFTFGSHSDHFIGIGMRFCIGLPNFIQIGGILTLYMFSRWRPSTMLDLVYGNSKCSCYL